MGKRSIALATLLAGSAIASAANAQQDTTRQRRPIYATEDLTVAGKSLFLVSDYTILSPSENASYDFRVKLNSDEEVKYRVVNPTTLGNIIRNDSTDSVLKRRFQVHYQRINRDGGSLAALEEAVRDGKVDYSELSNVQPGVYAVLAYNSNEGVIRLVEVRDKTGQRPGAQPIPKTPQPTPRPARPQARPPAPAPMPKPRLNLDSLTASIRARYDSVMKTTVDSVNRYYDSLINKKISSLAESLMKLYAPREPARQPEAPAPKPVAPGVPVPAKPKEKEAEKEKRGLPIRLSLDGFLGDDEFAGGDFGLRYGPVGLLFNYSQTEDKVTRQVSVPLSKGRTGEGIEEEIDFKSLGIAVEVHPFWNFLLGGGANLWTYTQRIQENILSAQGDTLAPGTSLSKAQTRKSGRFFGGLEIPCDRFGLRIRGGYDVNEKWFISAGTSFRFGKQHRKQDRR